MGLDAEFLNSIKNEIPKMVKAFAIPFEDQSESKKKWNYDHSFDFLYGEIVGWILGYIIRSFIEVYKREPTKEELVEISSLIEAYSDQIQKNLEKLRTRNNT